MDANVRDAARWFSWRRQRLDRTCRGVEDCLRSVIGVYSANPHGPLALLARVPRLLKGAAVEGVIGTKRAVRIPAMRRSIYLVPAETAHLAFWASKTSGAEYRWLIRRSGVSEERLAALRDTIVTAARAPMSAEDIRRAIDDEAVPITPVLQTLCAEGLLLRIKSSSIRSNDLTYAATDAWLGEPLRQVDPFEALVWLAGDYLSAFGPATPDDFAWWTGAPLKKASEALAGHDPVDVGDGALLHPRDERAFAGTRPHLGRVSLLPKWDCYTMGYAPGGRERFAPKDLLPALYDAGGNAQPMVLVEGEVQGTWSFRGAKRLTIRLEMTDAPGARLRAALEDEARLVGSFLEADDVAVEWAFVPRRAPRKPPRAKASTPRATKGPPRKAASPRRATTPRAKRSGSTPRRTAPSAPRRTPRR